MAQWQSDARRGEIDTGRYRCRYYAWGKGPALVFAKVENLASSRGL